MAFPRATTLDHARSHVIHDGRIQESQEEDKDVRNILRCPSEFAMTPSSAMAHRLGATAY